MESLGVHVNRQVQVLRRGAAILSALVDAGGGLGFAALQEGQPGLAPSTLTRLLHSLTAAGWIEHDERTRLYHFGPEALTLGATIAGGIAVPGPLVRLLARLAQDTGCSAAWFEIDGDGAVLRAKHEVPGGYRYMPVGGRLDELSSHGFGQMLLAHRPAAEVAAALRCRRGRGLVSAAELRVRLDRARQSGLLVEHGESAPGHCRMVSSSVDGQAAVGITVREPLTQERRLAGLVLAAARGVMRARAEADAAWRAFRLQ